MRVSPGPFNTAAEIDRFAEGVERIAQQAKGKLSRR
ncbi:MAG: hypothetical protein IKD06_04815 [Clostridia bacterium]|nr:hypothetical protein [Clostridia bacterium]